MKLDEIAQNMRDTLVPSPETVKAARAILSAGLGAPNGPDRPNYMTYSVLYIDGNPDADVFWTADEVVTDPGVLCLTREAAWVHCQGHKADPRTPAGRVTAYVVHFNGRSVEDWAVFIDHGHAGE